jgi:hypothetical protein
VGNAAAFPKWTRPRLFHNQTNPHTLDKTDSRSAALGMTILWEFHENHPKQVSA